MPGPLKNPVAPWCTTAQLHSTNPELRFCASLKPARGVSEIRNGEDLWQWSRLEIRLNAFRRSTIPQKQFIITIIIITPSTWSNIAEIPTRGSTPANENTVWKAFEEFEYLWKRDGIKVSIFGPTLTPLFLLKMAKIEKISSSAGNLQPLSYPNMLKWSLYLLSTFWEKYDYFFQYLGYIYHETGRGHKSKE